MNETAADRSARLRNVASALCIHLERTFPVVLRTIDRRVRRCIDHHIGPKRTDVMLYLIDSGDVAHHPYLPQFQAFVDGLRKSENMPLTDFDTAFESHRVVFAADLSAAEKRTVKMSEMAF